MIDQALLDILACPACDDRPPVRLTDEGLVCDRCGRIYPIKEGWPDMLVESAIMPGEKPAEPEQTRKP